MNLSFRRIWPGIAALALLAAITGGLYHDTLAASWRADDGAHLDFATWYAPWQYFFLPEITREFSSANVTPWNPFTYSVNLVLFGLRPAGFYAHQLVSLWLAAAATLALLRLWLSLRWSLFGAVLFLVAAPTAHIANELMTGHYLEGLLFAIGAAWCYVRALRKDSWRLALAGAGLYLLATTCKEIYVPLPAILLFLPERDWRARLRLLLSFGAVALGYVGWRVAVLGHLIGGYNPGQGGYAQAHVGRQLASVPLLLAGKDALGYCTLAAAAALGGWALMKFPRYLPLALVAAVLVMGPLVPLTVYPGIVIADRYLFLIWWMVAVLLAAALAAPLGLHRYVRASAALLILIAAVVNGRAEVDTLRKNHAFYEAAYRFVLSSGAQDIFLVPAANRPYTLTVLNAILDAERRSNPSAPVRSRRFVDESMLPLIDTGATPVFQYAAQCQCVLRLPATAPRDRAQVLRALREQPLGVSVAMLGAPYHEMRQIGARGGEIEAIDVRDSDVVIEGWARVRDDSMGASLIVGLPLSPDESKITRVPRADVATALHEPLMAYSGFRVNLKFGSAADAKRAAQSVCIVSVSDQSAMTLLANARNPGCQKMKPG